MIEMGISQGLELRQGMAFRTKHSWDSVDCRCCSSALPAYGRNNAQPSTIWHVSRATRRSSTWFRPTSSPVSAGAFQCSRTIPESGVLGGLSLGADAVTDLPASKTNECFRLP